jgi:hypothetical protein
MSDNRVCSNDGIVPDRDAAQYFGSSTDFHPVANRWSPHRIVASRVSNRDPMADHAVIANDGGPVNDDAAVMFDSEASPSAGRTIGPKVVHATRP